MGNIHQFSSFSQDAMKSAEREMSKTRRKGTLKLEAGCRYVMRLLPVPAAWGPVVAIAHQHWLNYGDEWFVFCCPRLHVNARCPQCEFVDKLSASNAKEDQDLAFKQRAQSTCFTNALVRAGVGESEDDYVTEFSFPPTVFDKIKAVHAENGDPWDLKEGYDLVFSVEPKKTARDAVVQTARGGRNTPLDPEAEWVRQLTRISERNIRIPTHEEVVRFMNGDHPWRQKGGAKRGGGAAGQMAGRAAGQLKGRNAAADADMSDDDEG